MSNQSMNTKLLESGYTSLGENEQQIETLYKKFENGLMYIFQLDAKKEVIGCVLLTNEQLESIHQAPATKVGTTERVEG